jgi:hypothetical protein
MRGEDLDPIAFESLEAVVLKRCASGLTPLHWLWIRFVSSLSRMEAEET